MGTASTNPRHAVYVTSGVAVLSLVTGVVYIGAPTVYPPLDPFLPDVVRTVAGFTGTVTGFLLLVSAAGLRRGLRAAWYSALFLFPLSAVQALIQSSPLSIPLLVLSVVGIPIVYRSRWAFDRQTELEESQVAAAAALAGVLAYGTVGSFALRDDYTQIETLLDAFYYTLVTATTVGYGDAVPETQMARLFALSIVVLGTSTFVLAAGVLLGPLLETRFKAALGKMTTTQLEGLNDHVLLLGCGDLTESILDELDGRTDVLVMTTNTELASLLTDRGENVLVENPRDMDALSLGNIDRAWAVIAATNSDGDDALAVLTARRANPEVYIVAGATNQENVEKLRDAGADTVISPSAIGSHLLADSAIERLPIDDVRITPLGEGLDSHEHGSASEGDGDR